MFGFFKYNQRRKKSGIRLIDLNGNELKENDVVLSHRYELDKCVIIIGDDGFEYKSIETQKIVKWTLMIDAATQRQKVEKLE